MEITDFISKYGERTNEINGVVCEPINSFSYDVVKKLLPNLLVDSSNYLEVVKILLNIEVKQNQEVLNFILWVQDQLKEINNQEKKTLSSEPEGEMVQAGIHKLNAFKHFGTIRSLTSCPIKQEQYFKLPYLTIYTNLLYNKVSGDIQKYYQEILRK